MKADVPLNKDAKPTSFTFIAGKIKRSYLRKVFERMIWLQKNRH